MTVRKLFLELYAKVTVITDIKCCQINLKSDGLPEISPMAVMKGSSLFNSHVTVISDISIKIKFLQSFVTVIADIFRIFQILTNMGKV